MNNLIEMNIEELIIEAHKQYEISRNAKTIARQCESLAVRKFLEEHGMSNTEIVHKPTGTHGYLRTSWDYRGLLLDFYPLKKNGEESSRKSEECTEWIACRGLEKNFAHLLTVYEQAKE